MTVLARRPGADGDRRAGTRLDRARGPHILDGGLEAAVARGVARLLDGGSLAGSTVTMDNTADADVPVHEALRAASSTPARALGVGDRIGTSAPASRQTRWSSTTI